ncbi:MAG: hypothetical protein V8R80_02430 [Eubacterium sp.]
MCEAEYTPLKIEGEDEAACLCGQCDGNVGDYVNRYGRGEKPPGGFGRYGAPDAAWEPQWIYKKVL